MTKKLGLQVKIKGDKKWLPVIGFAIDSHVNSTVTPFFFSWDRVSGFRSTNPKLFEKK